MEEFADELLKLQPDGTTSTLGRHRVFRFSTSTPAHSFESVVTVLGGGQLVELTARDSFDEQLAKFLLDQLDGVALPAVESRMIRVFPVDFPIRWQFGCVVVAPPRVATRFEHESRLLQRIAYWAVPAFDGEFVDKAVGDEFWHQINRKDGWRSVVVRWDRSRKTKPVFDA